MAVLPFRGRTAEEWIPVIAHHVRFRNRVQRLEVQLLHGTQGSALSVDGRLVVVLELRADGFALLDASGQGRLVAGFASVIGQLARSQRLIERVGWSASIEAGSITTLDHDRRRRARGPLDLVESYAGLLRESDALLPNRRAHLFLGTGMLRKPPQGVIEELLTEALGLANALEMTGHRRPRVLGGDEIRQAFGENFEWDDARSTMSASTRCGFDSLECSAGRAVSWWVEEWPRHGVTAESLSPVLLGEGQRRMAVIFEPIDAHLALRKAQVATTKGAADDELRHRAGFLLDRRRRAEADHRSVREEELVVGHQGLRFSGFLSVHAQGGAQLAEEVRRTELAAAQTGFVLRRLQGDHHRGWLATFPLARGLS